MGNIILHLHTSLDGVVSGVEHWASVTDELLDDGFEYYGTLGALLFGGNTFGGMAEYWTNAEASSVSKAERAFAQRMAGIPKYAVSRTPVQTPWANSSTLLSGTDADLSAGVERLRSGTVKDISVESGVRTWQRFLRLGLYDELMLFVQPVIAGSGEKLFLSPARNVRLRCVETKTFVNGVVKLRYRRESGA